MRISVITVTYNSEKTLENTIESFFRQTHANKELVIIDGASTDRTLDIINRYKQENVSVLSEPDKGMYYAINKGLNIYTGDAFGILNSDDCYAHENVLSMINERLQYNESVHAHLDVIDNHANKNVMRRWRGMSMPKSGFRSGWMPAHPTFYVRRELQERIGLFDTSYSIASDYDWMMRAIEKHGASPTLIEDIFVHMQAGGMSSNGIKAFIKHNLQAHKSRRKHLGAPLLDYGIIAKPARKLLQWSPLLSQKPSF